MAELNGGTPPIPHRTSAHGASGFVDLDLLRDAHGLVAVISQRRSNGVITIGIFKEFERDGGMERTTFIPETLFSAFNAISDLAQKRVTEIRAKGEEPIKHMPRGRI